MFSKKQENPFARGGHTLLDNALEIVGDVRFGGQLDIQGTVRGNVVADESSDAMVTVQSHGEVTGEIRAPKIVINGSVNGDVYCSKHLELSANAQVNGDVYYKVIEMVKGAAVNGKLMHIVEEEPETAALEPARPAKAEAASAQATKA